MKTLLVTTAALVAASASLAPPPAPGAADHERAVTSTRASARTSQRPSARSGTGLAGGGAIEAPKSSFSGRTIYSRERWRDAALGNVVVLRASDDDLYEKPF